MTLLKDSLEEVKASILMAIKNELVETYPSEFGDYTTSKGDTYSKVFWADTIRYQPKYPYCRLTQGKDRSEGYDEISYVRSASGVLLKRNTTRSIMNVEVEICDMGNEQIEKSSLQADTFAHKVARQLRKYFNGDGKLDWFSGNKYYPKQIGITVGSDITPIIDWSDTDTVFRYYFDVRFGWEDSTDSSVDLAESVNVRLYKDDIKIDEFDVKIGDK